MKNNDNADANIVLNIGDSWQEQHEAVNSSLAILLDGEKFDSILCVAGGWAGGNAASEGNQIVNGLIK